jgi:hypothetical protein
VDTVIHFEGVSNNVPGLWYSSLWHNAFSGLLLLWGQFIIFVCPIQNLFRELNLGLCRYSKNSRAKRPASKLVPITLDGVIT